MSDTKKEAAIGALWEKTSARGVYMTGNIEINGEKVGIVCFRNDQKTGKQPDWRILKAKPRTETPQDQREPLTDTDVPF